MNSIDIICPLFNAEKYIKKLISNLRQQECNYEYNLHFILTESSDKTEQILKIENCSYCKISKQEFSHSLIRENAAKCSKADIIVFITQDVQISNNHWLINLVNPIVRNEVSATYSKQISKFNNIEKYIRKFNYPDCSLIKSKDSIEKLGLYTFFFSDASSAIRRSVFAQLNFYDQRDLTLSEDMYIAYKLIMKNYKIKYCADSVVYHSHNYTLKQLYNRYKLTGIFFKENSYLNKFSKHSAGKKLAWYIFKNALYDWNFKVMLRFFPDMFTRYIGLYVGKHF